MTRDDDFKKLVRARMKDTGQNYTAARADLLDSPPPGDTDPTSVETWQRAKAEHQRVVARYVTDGRLVAFPGRRKARAQVLLHLVALFQPGREYPEKQVNQLLGEVHPDFAFWRRELVDYGYLQRDAGTYRLVALPPERPAHMAQELPEWEALWLPGHLAGPVQR